MPQSVDSFADQSDELRSRRSSFDAGMAESTHDSTYVSADPQIRDSVAEFNR